MLRQLLLKYFVSLIVHKLIMTILVFGLRVTFMNIDFILKINILFDFIMQAMDNMCFI